MQHNTKVMFASLAVAAVLGGQVTPAFANHEVAGMNSVTSVANANPQFAPFLRDFSKFLENIQLYVGGGNSASQNPTTSTPAADLRTLMNNLFSEHVTISATVMRNIIDDSADLEASKVAQLDNAVEIAKAFGSLYGTEAQAAVTKSFVEHIKFSNEYAEAVDDMDRAAKAEADEELAEYLTEIAVLLSSVINTVDEETVFTVLRAHEDLLNKAAEQYKRGDYAEAYETEREALKQIQSVSDVLSSGIVQTTPDKF